jgi:hypothetical protein
MAEPDKAKGDKSKKALVTESLVLAFAHSEAKALVGTDALRMVIGGQYRDLMRDGVFDLDPLANLFAEQPGYEEAPVASALLRFKSWQDHLGIEVTLPAKLAGLSSSERDALLERCTVPTAEVAKLLRGELAPPPPPTEEGYRQDPKPAAREAREKPGAPKAKRKGPLVDPKIAMVLGGLGLIGVGFGVWYGATHLRTPAPVLKPVATSFASDIPLAKAERFAGSVVAQLANDGWLSESADSRTRALEASFGKLPAGTKSLLIKDKAGNVRATVQPSSRSFRPIVRFY